jgi:hypothetical protein
MSSLEDESKAQREQMNELKDTKTDARKKQRNRENEV